MATELQISANRIKAQRSSGPRTMEGKSIARANAVKHGFAGSIPTMPESEVEEVRTRTI